LLQRAQGDPQHERLRRARLHRALGFRGQLEEGGIHHPAGRQADHRRRTIKPSARSCSAVRTHPESERIFLSKTGFSAILDAFSASSNYEVKVNLLQFQEVYVPVSVIPELAEHLRQYAHAYAYALSKSGKGMVTYINLGEGKFIKGAGAALKAGYVITIDYGSNWDGILAQDFDHLRMYGQGSSVSQANPYHAPTLNDMTTDVNFSHLAEEGKTVGLESLYFGPQHWLQSERPSISKRRRLSAPSLPKTRRNSNSGPACSIAGKSTRSSSSAKKRPTPRTNTPANSASLW
jgi:hypothetical protein